MEPALSRVPSPVREALTDMAGRVRARFGVRTLEIVLYGSQARGEAGIDSDVDLFVRVAKLTEKERAEIFELAAEVSLAHDVTLQAFAPLPAEHEWLDTNECRILRDIAAEGVQL